MNPRSATMRGNGNGNGNGRTHESQRAAPREEYEAALAAAGEPRDRIDRVARFAMEESAALMQMIREQHEFTRDLIALLNQRFRRLETEIAKLKAEPLVSQRFDAGAGGEGTLQ
jgi:hypothetical protein